MTLLQLPMRKVDDCIRIENRLGHLIATTCGAIVTFYEPVTPDELRTVAWVSENYDLLILNLIEE